MNELEQKTLPNATLVLILGIFSILTCCCYGLPGIIVGAIALFLYKKDKEQYDLNPNIYTNYSNLNTGRVLAIIGLVLSAITIILIIYTISAVGWDALQNPELLQERLDDLKNTQ